VSPVEITKDPAQIRSLFDAIAGKYDLMNNVISMGLHHYWRKYAVNQAGIRPGQSVLDVCCGTGRITGDLAGKTGPSGLIVGVDSAANMLEIAAHRLARHPIARIRLVRADAAHIPFPDNTFHCAMIGYGLRNNAHPGQVLAEMRRVVQPGGKVIALELSQPAAAVVKTLHRFYLTRIIPGLGRFLAGNQEAYQYLAQSVAAFPSPRILAGLFEASGLCEVNYAALSWGIVTVHMGIKR
jgi:demethylmenaquinone methyltransferase/2-methoxy-6-polyprenyl-1,4-benzoquinol methylase